MFKIRKIIKSIARTFPRFRPCWIIGCSKSNSWQFKPSVSQSDNRFNKILSEIELNGFYVIDDFFQMTIAYLLKMILIRCSSDPSVVQNYQTRVFGIEELSKKAYDFYSDKFLKSIADTYCSSVLQLYSFLQVETLPGSKGSQRGGIDLLQAIQHFFIFLDVEKNDAPFQVILNSHKIKDYLNDMSSQECNFENCVFQ